MLKWKKFEEQTTNALSPTIPGDAKEAYGETENGVPSEQMEQLGPTLAKCVSRGPLGAKALYQRRVRSW